MPRPKKNSKETKEYHDTYSTADQNVSKDGRSIRMNNGHVFKRVVLPSAANGQLSKIDQQLTDELHDVLDEQA